MGELGGDDVRLMAEIQYAGKSKNVNLVLVRSSTECTSADSECGTPHLSSPPKAFVDRRVQVKIEKEGSIYGISKRQETTVT